MNDQVLRQDEEDLKRLGYTQQLLREMGGFSNFAISFSIISVLTGAVLLYGYGLKLAGPIVNTVGWPVASVLTLAIAASMAELASAYPTAGGLYFWAFRLGGRGWAWTTAWLNMVGQVTITAGINVAAAIYFIGAATRILGLPADLRLPLFGSVTGWGFQLFVMVLLMIPQVVINIYGVRLTARLNDLSVYWHIAGGAVIVFLLAVLGKYHNDLAFLFRFVNTVNPLEASSADFGGGRMVPALVFGDMKVPSPLFALLPGLSEVYRAAPFFLVFVLALLQAQWTYTGYDASAHMAEETRMARLNSAWGIFLSVAVSAVVGYVLLVVLTWTIPGGDIAAVARDPYPVLAIADGNLSRTLANLVAVIIGGAMWLCGSSSVSSMARMWFAFARDGGMPGSRRLAVVSASRGVPVAAILTASSLAVAVSLYAAAFTVLTSASTITLYLAYGIPIFLNLRNRLRGRGEFATRETAPWNLGRKAVFVNIVAVAWILFITVVFALPPNELVLWTTLAFFLFLGAYWVLRARGRFRGPAGPR
ncbi:MAG TPA: amino acid permease [Thermoanaerobaculia bacterium]|nr:amino acid permease [Thermoanaerobaculia bacterium]